MSEGIKRLICYHDETQGHDTKVQEPMKASLQAIVPGKRNYGTVTSENGLV